MPIYDYRCWKCGWFGENLVPFIGRDHVLCPNCNILVVRQMSLAAIKIVGQAVQGGGPDRFTADMLGVKLDDLPAGLKTGIKASS
jgi:putative FmdB family regulatory protein